MDILFEDRGNYVLYYLRDNQGNIFGIEYQGEKYYFGKNNQNDVTSIYNSKGEIVVTYTYDSYGKILDIKDALGVSIEENDHIGIVNPFRYRSYYYDNESRLYYLKSRYYNPEWGRFISPEDVIGTNIDILGINQYIYANNNPLSFVDQDGLSPLAIPASVAANGALSIFTIGIMAVAAIKMTPSIINDFCSIAQDVNEVITESKSEKKSSKKSKDKEKNMLYML